MAGHSDDSTHAPTPETSAPVPNTPLIVTFDLTQILGLLLLLVIVLTARLSKSIRRSSAWYNFLITWMLSCISYIITLGHQTGREPDFGVCLVQSMLVYAAPTVTVTAGLSFSIEMWRIVTGATSGRHSVSPKLDLLLIFAPYIVHLLICMEVLAFGLMNRSLVVRDTTFMYCHLNHRMPPAITAIVVILMIIVALGFFTSTAIYLRRHWAAFRRLQRRQALSIQKTVVRFGIFSILPTLGLLFSVIRVTAKFTGVADGLLTLAVGTLPLGAALIFGTQSDLLVVWMFWKRRTDPSIALSQRSITKFPSGRVECAISVEHSVHTGLRCVDIGHEQVALPR